MPQNAAEWFEAGRQQLQQGNDAEALQYFDQALSLGANNADAWNGRGAALKKLDRFQEALDSYDRALTLNPQSYKTWFNKGLLLEQLGQDVGAIACYEKVLEIKPDVRDAGDRLLTLSRKISLPGTVSQPSSLTPVTQTPTGRSLSPETAEDASAWFELGYRQFEEGDFQRAIDRSIRCDCLSVTLCDCG
jgi:tetratricopeptide (TPR) repeat protein